jgi:ATP-binding cassette subfamily C (CFTR/MRP) protein 1
MSAREVKDYKTTDPVGAAGSTNRDEPLASEEDKDIVEEDEKHGRFTEIKAEAEVEERPELGARLRSYATNTSATSAATTTHSRVPQKRKKWYKNPNPLKWGKVPEVPKERGPSREYNAGFFSVITFQWMAPLMSVCTILVSPREKSNSK